MTVTALRSALFVPASRPERIPTALASGADAVIIDLEDAVAEHHKAKAREALENFLQQSSEPLVYVRVNAPGSVHFQQDLALCARHAGIIGIIVPKAETTHALECAAASHKPFWALIETARGLLTLADLVKVPGLARLCFGALDLGLELGLTPGSEGAQRILDQARYQLLLHSQTAGLTAPFESPHPDTDDVDQVQHAAERARDMGFAGMLCIHPRQLAPIHSAFTPSSDDIAWAHRVLGGATQGQGAFSIDGQMIDAPVIERARRMLALAR